MVCSYQRGIVIRDVDDLNEHTPRNLSTMWSEWCEEFPVGSTQHRTVTIYHFGFSLKSGQIHSYAYKSENAFKRILIPNGTHTKPEISIPKGTELPRDLKMLMDEQRNLQSGLPREQRVHIGGEIQVIRLEQDGFIVTNQARFADFDADQAAILSRV